MSKKPPRPPVNDGPVFWPGTSIEKSMDNVFTAAQRRVTQVDWANDPNFRITVKQRQQQNEARKHGWGDGNMGSLTPRKLQTITPRAFGQHPTKKVATA